VSAQRSVGVWVVRLLAGIWGLGLVGAVLLVAAPNLRWWVGGPAALAVVLAMGRGRLVSFVPWAIAVVTLGILLAANTGRVPIPTAVVLGLLVLGYLLLAELGDTIDDASGRISWTALAGWVWSMLPVLGAGLMAVLVVGAAVLVPVRAGTWLVVAAPVVLLVAVVVAVRRKRDREGEGGGREGEEREPGEGTSGRGAAGPGAPRQGPAGSGFPF
jgi:hypothetical protein